MLACARQNADTASGRCGHRAYWHSKDFLLFVLSCAAHGTEAPDRDLSQSPGMSSAPAASAHAGVGPSTSQEDDEDEYDDGDDGGEAGCADDLADLNQW